VNANGQPKLADAIQVLEQVVMSVPLAELPTLLGSLEKAKALSWSRMFAEQQHAQPKTTGKTALLTANQVAERLNVKKSFVYEVARQKKLKSVRLGEKYVMFTESAVDDFLTQGGA